MTKKQITNPALKTWAALNSALKITSELDCWDLLAEEQQGRARPVFMQRIYCRINKIRADRERNYIQTNLELTKWNNQDLSQ